jgi:hypothetical protein
MQVKNIKVKREPRVLEINKPITKKEIVNEYTSNPPNKENLNIKGNN